MTVSWHAVSSGILLQNFIDLTFTCRVHVSQIYRYMYRQRGLQLFIKMLCFTETYFIAKSCASVL